MTKDIEELNDRTDFNSGRNLLFVSNEPISEETALRTASVDEYPGETTYPSMDAQPDKRLLTDNALFELCCNYGRRARHWTRRFAGLLPEVSRRRLYQTKGYGSIYHFAAVVGGMSRGAVDEVLSLYQRLEGKPNLQALLTE